MSKIYCFDPKNYNVKLQTLYGSKILDKRHNISLYLNCTLKDCDKNTIEINNKIKKAISKYLKVDNDYIKSDGKLIKSKELYNIEQKSYKYIETDTKGYCIYVKNDSILGDSIKIGKEDSKNVLYSDQKELDFELTDKIEFYLENEEYSKLSEELKKEYETIFNKISNYYKSNYNNKDIIKNLFKIENYKNYVKNEEYFINDEKKISLKVNFTDTIKCDKIVFKDSDDTEITNKHIIDNYIDKYIIGQIKLNLKNLTKLEDKLNYIKKDFNSSGFKIDLKLEKNSIVFNVKKGEGVDEIALYLDYLIISEEKKYINFIKDLYNNEKCEKPKKKFGFYKLLFSSYYKYINNEKYLDECINIIKSLGGYYSKFKDISDRISALKDILNENLKENVLKLNNKLEKEFDVKKHYMTYGVIDYFSSNFADTIKYYYYKNIDYIPSNGNNLTFKIIISDSVKYKLSDYKISVLKEIKNIKTLDDLKDEIIKKNEDYVRKLIDSNLNQLKLDILEKYKDLNELNKDDFKRKFNKNFKENIEKVNINIVDLIKTRLLKIESYKALFDKLKTDDDKENYTTSIYERYKKLFSRDFINHIFDDKIEYDLESEFKCKMLLSLFQNQYLKKIETYKFDQICQYMLNTTYELKYDNFKKIFKDDFIKFVDKLVDDSDILDKIKKSIDFSELNNKLNEKFNILIKDIIRQFTDKEIDEISKFTKLSEVDNYKNKEKDKFKINLVSYISIKNKYFKGNYDKFKKDSTNLLFNDDKNYVDSYYNQIINKLNKKRTEIEENVKIDNEESSKLYDEMKTVINNVENIIKNKINNLEKSNLESYEFKTEDEIKNYINEELKKIDNFEDRYGKYSKNKDAEGNEISSLIDSKIASVSNLLKQNYELKVDEISIVKIKYLLQDEDQINENIKTNYNSFINNEENKKFDSRKKYKELYNFITSKLNYIEDVLKDNQSIKDSEDVINVDEITLNLKVKKQYKKMKDNDNDDDGHKDDDDEDPEKHKKPVDDPNKKEKKDQSENNDSEVPSDVNKESDNKKGCCAKCSGGNKTKSEPKTKSSKKPCCGK